MSIPHIHDLIFSIGGVILAYVLYPAVKSKAAIPLYTTCFPTAVVLFIYAVNYATLGYWFAALTQGISALMWFYLCKIQWKEHR